MMTEPQRAVIQQLNLGREGDLALYWIVDRLTVRGFTNSNLVDYGSSDKVLNRLLVEQGKGGDDIGRHRVQPASGA